MDVIGGNHIIEAQSPQCFFASNTHANSAVGRARTSAEIFLVAAVCNVPELDVSRREVTIRPAERLFFLEVAFRAQEITPKLYKHAFTPS